jgi:hypothetical protein
MSLSEHELNRFITKSSKKGTARPKKKDVQKQVLPFLLPAGEGCCFKKAERTLLLLRMLCCC